MDLKQRAIDIFDIAAEPTLDILSGMFLAGIAGEIVPGLACGIMAYKQKRSEQMFEKFMIEVREKYRDIEERLNNLDKASLEWIGAFAFPVVCDYVLQNRQEEKIKYLVNGLLCISEGKTTSEDLIINFYDTMNALTFADLIVLKKIPNLTLLDAQELDIRFKDAGGVTLATQRLQTNGLLEIRIEDAFKDANRNIAMNVRQRGREGIDLTGSFPSLQPEISQYGELFLRFFCKNNI